MDVYRLVRIEGPAPALNVAQGEAFSSRGGRDSYTATAVTGAHLAKWLEGRMGRPVLDGTGLDGHYDVSITWDPDVPDDLQRVLREQLGLILEDGRATVEILVVR